jgi:hypothetical protein
MDIVLLKTAQEGLKKFLAQDIGRSHEDLFLAAKYCQMIISQLNLPYSQVPVDLGEAQLVDVAKDLELLAADFLKHLPRPEVKLFTCHGNLDEYDKWCSRNPDIVIERVKKEKRDTTEKTIHYLTVIYRRI